MGFYVDYDIYVIDNVIYRKDGAVLVIEKENIVLNGILIGYGDWVSGSSFYKDFQPNIGFVELHCYMGFDCIVIDDKIVFSESFNTGDVIYENSVVFKFINGQLVKVQYDVEYGWK